MPPSPTSIEELLKEYNTLYAERHASMDPSEKVRIGRTLATMENQIRSAVKADPVKEPLTQDFLNNIADQISAMGIDMLANRLRRQHARHPIYIPFRDKEHLRAYLSSQLREDELQRIPEFAVKKKFLGIFG